MIEANRSYCSAYEKFNMFHFCFTRHTVKKLGRSFKNVTDRQTNREKCYGIYRVGQKIAPFLYIL